MQRTTLGTYRDDRSREGSKAAEVNSDSFSIAEAGGLRRDSACAREYTDSAPLTWYSTSRVFVCCRAMAKNWGSRKAGRAEGGKAGKG